MPSLSSQQRKFAKLLEKLLHCIHSNGWECTLGECLRTPEQQEIYLKSGKSKIVDSKHLNKLAIDINLFINGEFTTNEHYYRKLGDFWRSLDSECVSGSDWNWDFNHFQLGR